MQKRFIVLLTAIIFLPNLIFSQQPQKPASSEIFSHLQKISVLGSVLYIAAHPDDENTRLISYFANDKKYETGYLSLTRGDGGQNLIGSELRELLGVIRTQELLEARKIDGGEQFFSRANDFGFSKNPDETLAIWDKAQVLADVVWQIRKFQPDVIINRFDARTPGTTHGHHTSSAMLSVEAFDLANDPKSYPGQLQYVKLWQPKRQFFNTSYWFYGGKDKFDKADKSSLYQIQTGTYYSLSGKSNQEIAALSRSRHQSQGFGSTGSRGEDSEYLEFLKGTAPANRNDIFDGIDVSWNRIKNGKPIGEILASAEKNFDFKNPSATIPELVKVYNLIQNLDENHWKPIKLAEIKKVIAECAGLYMEAVSTQQDATPGSTIKVNSEIINRSDADMKLESISFLPEIVKNIENAKLTANNDVNRTCMVLLPSTLSYTNPYWLDKPGTVGMYCVDDQINIGKPDVIRQLKAVFNISVDGVSIPFEKDIVYKYNDDVKGEVYQPFDVIPEVTSALTEKVYIFKDHKPKQIDVRVKSGKDKFTGNSAIDAPSGWKVSPVQIPFILAKKGDETILHFTVTPPETPSEAVLKSIVSTETGTFTQDKININYPHISAQQVLKPSIARAIKTDLKAGNEKIAYIMGVGDEVPKSLMQMGYSVDIIKPDLISKEKLADYDVVMTGIRAYNTVSQLAAKQEILFDFVKEGKTMIVQYNTPDDFVTDKIAPFPLKISRDRVTEENAEVRFLQPDAKVLNFPNKITAKDFTGWKQEQGLNYPGEWDKAFIPIISSNDKGESPKNGALLVADYGKGHYIYTGLSFFRELPEGVIGAFRLMANLISIGKNE